MSWNAPVAKRFVMYIPSSCLRLWLTPFSGCSQSGGADRADVSCGQLSARLPGLLASALNALPEHEVSAVWAELRAEHLCVMADHEEPAARAAVVKVRGGDVRIRVDRGRNVFGRKRSGMKRKGCLLFEGLMEVVFDRCCKRVFRVNSYVMKFPFLQ